MTKKRFIILVIVCILGFLALVGYRISEKKKLEKKIEDTKPVTTSVSTILPKKAKISEFFHTTGTVVTNIEINVVPKATGRILSLYVDEGSIVSAGQKIADIEHSELDSQISQAKAQIAVSKANLDLLVNGPLNSQISQSEAIVKQAEANVSQIKISLENSNSELLRYKKLKNQGAITSQQYDTFESQNHALKKQVESAQQQVLSSKAGLKTLKDGTRKEQVLGGKAQLEQVTASLNLLESQLENYQVKAPISGVVTKKILEAGSMAGMTSSIVMISKISDPELEMDIPEKQILKIKLGQTVETQSSAFPGKKLIVKIKEISPVVDPQTRLIRTRGFIKSDLPLKIGMIFDCKFLLTEDSNNLVIPNEALLINEKKKYVYIVEKNKAKEKVVTTGIQTPEDVQIITGLTEEDIVIVKGNTFIKSGDLVEIQPELKN
ncbi:MAG: efflux RND transporter periplasmic adaptor subunit [Cyanobacteriota bacterium]